MEKRINWPKFWEELKVACIRRNLNLMKPEQAMEIYRQLTEELIERQLRMTLIVPRGNPPVLL